MLTYLKAKIFKILSYLSIVLTPVVPALIWLGVFIVSNLICNIWAAIKQKLFNRFYVGALINKLFASAFGYLLFIIVARGFDLVIPGIDKLPFSAVQIAIGICSLREGKPFLENLGIVLEIDIWKYFKDKIKISVK